MRRYAFRIGLKGICCTAIAEGELTTLLTLCLRKEIAMVAITYGRVPAPRNAARARSASPRQNIIGRFFTAVMEARLQQAYREINRRAYLFDKTGIRTFH